MADGLRWVLTPGQDGVQMELPQTHEQSVQEREDGSLAVTVRPGTMPSGVALPYEGEAEAALAALKPSDWVQSRAPAIRKLAARAVGDAADAATGARRIERFVREHIDDKDLSVGYASALEVAESRQGDCTEHAVLAAALCKAAGIPARLAVGFAYAEGFGGRQNVLVPHAWTQVYLEGKWYSLDAALPGFDAGHILLDTGQGAPVDFLGAAVLLGRLKVEAVRAAR
jgi:transglutaminase-like putative cysteine protease